MRKPILAANWKMNKTLQEAMDYLVKLGAYLKTEFADIVICPPSPLLGLVMEVCRQNGFSLGAQNMHWEEAGAYTGEISPLLLQNLGTKFAILGHSERRQYFAETDDQVSLKVRAAVKYALTPIICVGETIDQRRAGETMEVVSRQIRAALKGLDDVQAADAVVAYEPVWAIGSNLPATAADAQAVAARIRGAVREMFNEKAALSMRIQYGGSVKPENIADFMREPDIDGALVGGSSLDARQFAEIIRSVSEVILA